MNKDRKRLEEKNHDFNYSHKSIKPSKEVKLLSDRFKWILLSKEKNIHYSHYRKWYSECHAYLDAYQLEDEYLKLDDQFPIIKELKECFFDFDDYGHSAHTIDRGHQRRYHGICGTAGDCGVSVCGAAGRKQLA